MSKEHCGEADKIFSCFDVTYQQLANLIPVDSNFLRATNVFVSFFTNLVSLANTSLAVKILGNNIGDKIN